MEDFWDARAREDAFWFVDNRRPYRAGDEPAFWEGGERALEGLTEGLGWQLWPDDVVVDVGCGVGRLTRALSKRVARVIALDVSSEMLTQARRLNPDLDNVEWLHGDGQSLHPVPDGSVDACLSHVVFRHLPSPSITLGYISEIGRVLRHGGRAAFDVSTDPLVHKRDRYKRARLAAALRRRPRGTADEAWLGSAVDLADLHATAANCGLSVERMVGEGTDLCLVLVERR